MQEASIPRAFRFPAASTRRPSCRRIGRIDVCSTPKHSTPSSHVTQSGYKWGCETDIEMDLAPKGLSEDTIRLISARKQEPEWLLEWRLKAYRRLAADGGAALGARRARADRLPGPSLLRRAEEEARAEEPGRGRSGAAGDLREARHPAEGAGDPGGRRSGTVEGTQVAVDAVFDSVSVATTFRATLTKAGVIFCSISRGGARSSRAGAAVSRHRWCRSRTTSSPR